MVRLIREHEVESTLEMPDVVASLREAFADYANGNAFNQPRSRVKLNGEILHVLPAALPAQEVLGLKAYTAFRAGIRFHVLLYDARNGELKAIIQAKRLGELRTGGTTSLALDVLAAEMAATATLFGVGNIASAMLDGMLTARKLRRIYVCSRSLEKSQQFCEQSPSASEVELVACADSRKAVEESDIVVTATTSKTPVFDGEALKPGVTVAAAGSNLLQKREIDSQAVKRSDRIVVESIDQAQLEAGDLFPAIDAGFLHWNQVECLGDIVAGIRPGRVSEREIILFKSVGLGLQDMAVAAKMYQLSLDHDLGEDVNM